MRGEVSRCLRPSTTARPISAATPPTNSAPLAPPEPAVEAPDRGDWNAESPEDAVSRRAEAPEAGDSRAGLLESEFTRGRSTS